MNHEIILEFLSRRGDASSCRAMTDAVSRLLNDAGFPYYAILRTGRPDAEIPDHLLTGYFPEEWARTYDDRKYGLVDPVMHYLRKSQEAFRWRDALETFRKDAHYSKMRRMMNDAARIGLEDGYVFPVHGDRGLIGYMSVGGPPVDLMPVQLALLDAAAKKAFWLFLRICAPDVVTEMTEPVRIQLTRREMEALGCLADGMTSNEISQVLSISSNTVDWYMNGIQDKLKAKNRHHAVAIAFRLGLIS